MMVKPANRPRLWVPVWFITAATGTAVWIAGPIVEWTRLQTVCHHESRCLNTQLNVMAARTLTQHHVSLVDYALGSFAMLALLWVLWYGLAALLVFKRPEDRGALLAAFFLVIFPMWEYSDLVPWWGWLGGVFVGVLLLFALIFPDGRFQPPWTKWLAVAVALFFGLNFLSSLSFLNGPLGLVMFVGLVALVVVAQVHRFRTVSSWSERQRTKWAVLGLTAAVAGVMTTWLLGSILPIPTGSGSIFSAVDNQVGTAMVMSVIPVSMAVAVLRNRLWDIDRVMSRALAYAVLTAVVIGVYVGSVVGLQSLLALFAHNGSPVAIGLSTLAIVALFGPLHRRIQRTVERRFYRARYDAARTVAAFGERLRDQVDLEQLSHGLTGVVRDTLHPEHVSLWLRQT